MEKAPIVLTDGKSTPVDHTFNPTMTQGDQSWFTNRAANAGVTAGYETLYARASLPTGNEEVSRSIVKLTVPVLEQPNGGNSEGYVAPMKKAFEQSIQVTAINHKRGDKASRKDLRIMLVDFLESAEGIALFDDQESFW